MRQELIERFGVQVDQVTVIPFGINNSVPNTTITPAEAKQRLGSRDTEKTLLFFGNIAPYKGLEYLTSAFEQIVARHENYRLIIAGSANNCEKYWDGICQMIPEDVRKGRILVRAEFVPDDKTELYFKAADVLVLPHKYINQSGVLFVGYSFGLPVLGVDVGSLMDDVLEGQTGFVFSPEDRVDLARAIEK